MYDLYVGVRMWVWVWVWVYVCGWVGGCECVVYVWLAMFRI